MNGGMPGCYCWHYSTEKRSSHCS